MNKLKMNVYGRPDRGVNPDSICELITQKPIEDVISLMENIIAKLENDRVDISPKGIEKANFNVGLDILKFLDVEHSVSTPAMRDGKPIPNQKQYVKAVAGASYLDKNYLEYDVNVWPMDLIQSLMNEPRIGVKHELSEKLYNLTDYVFDDKKINKSIKP